jgi:glutathione S-transferase
MANLELCFFPGTCAEVSLIALEESRLPFTTQLITFTTGEHKSPSYLAINPKGKVPTLLVDGQPLTETLSILAYLDAIAAPGTLMPVATDPLAAALARADLAWCASTIHPIVTRLRIPDMFAGPSGRQAVWGAASEQITPHFALMEQRLAQQDWMLGDWSVVDAFVYWLWNTSVGADFDPAPYPNLVAHSTRMDQRPAVARALALEGRTMASLAAQGLAPQFPPSARPQ